MNGLEPDLSVLRTSIGRRPFGSTPDLARSRSRLGRRQIAHYVGQDRLSGTGERSRKHRFRQTGRRSTSGKWSPPQAGGRHAHDFIMSFRRLPRPGRRTRTIQLSGADSGNGASAIARALIKETPDNLLRRRQNRASRISESERLRAGSDSYERCKRGTPGHCPPGYPTNHDADRISWVDGGAIAKPPVMTS